MSTAVIYSSSYGTVRKCVDILKNELKDKTAVFSLKENRNPDISEFEKVIIGGSIRAGAIQKELKTFVECNREALATKKIGLFICCIDEKEINQYFKNAFPDEILNLAVKKSWFGGEVIYSSYNFFIKFLMKRITKSSTDIHNIQKKNIAEFAKFFNGKDKQD